MSEMIERVVIAIRRNKFVRNGRASVFDPSNISEEELGEARAAIEAMREPINAMVKAHKCARYWANGQHASKTEAIREGHRAAIDAALSEKPQKDYLKEILLGCGKCGWMGTQSKLNENCCHRFASPFESWPLEKP